ncbi:hypothetical protein AAK938_08530 [Aerococcaceae bacterium 50-4]
MTDTFDYLNEFQDYENIGERLNVLWADFNHTVTELSLYHYPDDTNMNSLLNAYTKDSLLYLLEYGGYGYSIDRLKNYKKAIVVDTVQNFMETTLQVRIASLSSKEIKTLKAFLGDTLILDSKDGMYFQTELLPKTTKLGLTHIKIVDNYFSVIIPDEVRELIYRYKEVKLANRAFLKQVDYMKEKVNAAANLYGFIPTSTFIKWTIDDQNINPPFESNLFTEPWLITLVSLTCFSQNHYYIGDLTFASNKFQNFKEVVAYHGLLANRPDFDPYIPTPIEMKRFSRTTFNTNSAIYRNFTKELKKATDNYSMMLTFFTSELIKGTSPIDLFKFANEKRLLIYDSEENAENFISSLIALSNDTRMWLNRGHKPSEIFG